MTVPHAPGLDLDWEPPSDHLFWGRVGVLWGNGVPSELPFRTVRRSPGMRADGP